MRNRAITLLVSCITLLVTSCVTETRRDKRFTPIFGKPVETTMPLYLYARSATRNGDPSLHCIATSKMIIADEKSEILAIVPVGHRITFEKLRRGPHGEESLIGFMEYKKVRYPVEYFLGFHWEVRIQVFKIPGKTQDPM